MRILARVRLSRSTEESTSVERQRELIENYAKTNDHEIVAWAEDIDVSGSISPFNAPELGQWLTEEKKGEWDMLVAWKLDRVARNAIELNKLFGWLEENDKTLVCINDNIDLSNWVGRMVASVIAGVAEGELETIRDRVTAGKKKVREQGRFGGGRPTYGWKVVPAEGGGWKLELDPVAQEVLQRIISDVLRGESTNSIAKALNEEGVASPANYYAGKPGGRWTSNYIRLLLKNKTLLGWMSHDSKPVLDGLGKPVRKGPPALTMEQFDQLQEALASRSFKRTTSGPTSPLLHILKCWECDTDMYIRRPSKKNSYYYVCPNGCTMSNLNGEQIEGMIYDQFEEELGDFRVMEKAAPVSSNTADELREAKSAYADVSNYLGSAPDADTRKMLFSQLDILGKRISELEQLILTTKQEWLPTTKTYREVWEDLDPDGRRQLMIKSDITVRAHQLTRGSRWKAAVLETEFIIPDDLRDRLQK